MLEIKCQEHLAKVREFADTAGIREAFEKRLSFLSEYSGGRCVCELYVDTSPQSFYFKMKKDGELWFNGGLIYHGSDHWGVHT